MKKSVGIVIGGKTVEHEVSVITGLQVFDNIDRNLYEPKIIYIQKDGKWLIGEGLHDIKNFKLKKFEDAYEILYGFKGGKMMLYPHPNIKQGLFSKKYNVVEIDLVFPAVHGTNVEDGALHGTFQMNDVPCAFGTVLSSALGMDKVMMKKVFKSDGLPIVEYLWFYRNEWKNDRDAIIDKVNRFGYPVIVKPANLGSSIGISKACNQEEIIASIEVSVSYDRKIIIERCIENVKEINCAVIGYEDELKVSYCEEPLGWKEILTYEDKYLNDTKINTESKRRIPANLDKQITDKIQQYAKLAFKSIDCAGNARIDFLYDGNNIYVNEINTIPGSIAFYLWEASGLSFKQMVTEVLNIAQKQQNEKEQNIISYDVDLLNKMGKNGKHK